MVVRGGPLTQPPAWQVNDCAAKDATAYTFLNFMVGGVRYTTMMEVIDMFKQIRKHFKLFMFDLAITLRSSTIT